MGHYVPEHKMRPSYEFLRFYKVWNLKNRETITHKRLVLVQDAAELEECVVSNATQW